MSVSAVDTTSAAGRVFCPDCNMLLSPTSLSKHRRTQHGFRSAARRGRPVGSKNGVRNVHKPQPVTKPKPVIEPVTAEQITRTVAAMLWPDGVPLDMLERLLRWNVQTEDFLIQAKLDQ